MNKFEIRTEKKKKEIIAAAIKLFSKNGYIKTNIKTIANEANVSQVSIYNYFESKQKLLSKCVEEIMEETFSKARHILAEHLPFEDKLVKAINLCNTEINSSFNNFLSAYAQDDPEFIKLLIEEIQVQRNALYQIVFEYGIKEKAIRQDVSISTILKLCSAINKVGAEEVPEKLQATSQELISILLNGILISE